MTAARQRAQNVRGIVVGMRILALALVAACTHDVTPALPDAPAVPVAPDAAPASTAAPAWRQQVIYLVIPDRFRNGDRSNDAATGCFDPGAPKKFHGGDIAGLRQHLPYLKDLGV